MKRNTLLDLWLKFLLAVLCTAVVGGLVAGIVALGVKWADDAQQSSQLSTSQQNQGFFGNNNMPTSGYVVWFSGGQFLSFTGKNAEKNAEATLHINNNSADGVMMSAAAYDNGVAQGTIPMPSS